MKDKYVIMALPVIDYMKDENENIKIYDSFNDAELACGMYELDNVWICKLVYNYIEGNENIAS